MGQLNEYTERKEMPSDVLCMALAQVPQGEQRSRFLAVGLSDKTVRVVSLDPAVCVSSLSLKKSFFQRRLSGLSKSPQYAGIASSS